MHLQPGFLYQTLRITIGQIYYDSKAYRYPVDRARRFQLGPWMALVPQGTTNKKKEKKKEIYMRIVCRKEKKINRLAQNEAKHTIS